MDLVMFMKTLRVQIRDVSFIAGFMLPIRRVRWAERVARMVERSGAYRGLVGKSEGSISLGRPRRRWEDNTKMDLQEVGWGTDWIDLVQDRDRWRVVVNAVMNIRVL
jgi:hypothetical protein